MNNLTPRQQEVLDYLSGHIRTDGYSPSLQKIASHFGWASHNAAAEHLRLMERKGAVRKTPRGYLPV